ncbi:hypothetical protein TNIN_430592 [Trichonephila inaurata madagascariensis]|uniref:EGF-like domain-containing protein n=1 Tax=Trichonephila inaurata madagascariensis TaxID=2747483 RepID=A0A8X6WQC1_9ARAC|nr:hypothetical protein TNIN_430592 [Trichonephila inaurata madagascariensis]
MGKKLAGKRKNKNCFVSIIIHNGQCETVQDEKETIAQSKPRTDYFQDDSTKRDFLARNVSFEEPVRNCESDTCQNNGMCIDQEDGFMCMCESPYFGKTCEESK